MFTLHITKQREGTQQSSECQEIACSVLYASRIDEASGNNIQFLKVKQVPRFTKQKEGNLEQLGILFFLF